jgi:hypothetical protein
MGGGSSNAAADQARADETARQQRVSGAIASINDVFSQFGEPFFESRRQAALNYNIPQLDRQYGDARRDLAFRLADSSLTRSSVAGRSMADLEREYALRKQEVADQAAGYVNETRADLERSRGNLIQMAQSTGDAALAGNAATNEAARIAAQPAFSPLAQVFQNVGAAVGSARRQRLADDIRSSAGVQIFKPSGTGSGRTVNA